MRTRDNLDVEFANYIDETCNGDVEAGHARADDALCRLLKTLGYDRTVDAFEGIAKWYA